MKPPRDKLARRQGPALTLLVLALGLTVAVAALSNRERSARSANPAASAIVARGFGRLPLSFELNQGQSDPRVRFLARGQGYTLFLTPTESVLALRKSAERLRVQLKGANPNAKAQGADQLAGRSNYFIGRNPAQWHANIANFARVRFEQVYPGVDVVYHGSSQRQLEYDFVLAPGTDPRVIDLAFDGAKTVALGRNGGLILRMARGLELSQRPPEIYQQVEGKRREVEGGYVIRGGNRVGFTASRYDKRLPLVIDPTLAYSTYLGGSDDDASNGIAVDGSGSAYVTGFTASTNFPTTPGVGEAALEGPRNAFVAKLNAGGTALLYSTYLGGTSSDEGKGIVVDGSGNAYVTGDTASTDFPVTAGAFQAVLAGSSNAFVAKLNAAGSALLYCTYLGGSSIDGGVGIALALDGSGAAFVTGFTQSTDFPTTAGAFHTALGGTGAQNAFVTKVNAAGSALAYSTYLGGSGIDAGGGIAVDSSGSAYVTGSATSTNFPVTAGSLQTALGGATAQNAFIAKLNANGSALAYSTYLGGSGSDGGNGIAVDGSGSAYITGSATSTNFPVTAGSFQTALGGATAQNAFISKLNASGSALAYSTYLGGGGQDGGNGIAVDSGNAYVAGSTSSSNFPVTAGAFQTALGGAGAQNAFVSELKADGSALLYSTYLGGSNFDDGNGIAVDGTGKAYVTGDTASTNFPIGAGAFQTTFGGGAEDAFVSNLFFPTPTPTPTQTPTATPTGPAASIGAGTPTPTALGLGPTPANPATAPTPTSPAAAPTATFIVPPPPVGGGGGPPPPPPGPSGSQISLGPNRLFFDPRPVGSASRPKSVTLGNGSGFRLHVYHVTVSSQEFAESDNCVGSIPAHGSCTIKVVFAPTTAGRQTGTLQVNDEVNSTPQGMVKYPQSVALSGMGTDPGQTLFAAPDAVSFGPQKLGTISAAKTVTLNNMQNAAVHLTAPSASGDFTVTDNNCAASMASGSKCIISVAFAPVKAGARSGSLTIATDAGPKPLTVSLIGAGQMPAPTPTPVRATPVATPRPPRHRK